MTWRERIHGPAREVIVNGVRRLATGALIWGYYRGRATWCDNPEVMQAICTHSPRGDGIGHIRLLDKRNLVSVRRPNKKTKR